MGGRFNFLKKFSSKLDKLFLGDMIQSNKSDSKNLSKDSQYSDSSINSNNLTNYISDKYYNHENYENYENYDGNENYENYDGNDNYKNYDGNENYDMNRNCDRNYNDNYNQIHNQNYPKNYDNDYDRYYGFNESINPYFEDKYADYIYPEKFNKGGVDEFNRNVFGGVNRDVSDGFNKEPIFPDFRNEEIYLNNMENNSRYNYSNGKYSNKNNSKTKGLSSFRLKDLKNKLLNSDESSKKNFGIIAISLIILVLGASVFYFGIFQPFQNELNTEKTAKLNELNTLYKGPLAINSHFFTLENRIQDSHDINEIKSIDILRTATGDWRKHHFSKINAYEDSYGRIMMSYSDDSKKVLMPVNDATLFVNENDAKVLSNVVFGKVDTVIVPVYITRLQATGGLISVGSIVDIYSLSSNESNHSSNSEVEDTNNLDNISNNTNNGNDNLNNDSGSDSQENSEENAQIFSVGDNSQEFRTVEEEPDVSGATVLAILRSKDGGIIDSTFSKSTNLIKGNKTYPTEDSSSFSTDAEELLKSSIFRGHDNGELSSYLSNYGIKLSNYERLSNIGELDTDYLVLLEVPRSDVDFMINNMENLILTIPTEYAPNWAVKELNATYYKELNSNNNF